METAEQLSIIGNFSLFICLAVTACAGAGKTTTAIKAACKAKGRTVMLMYNRQLKSDNEAAIAKCAKPDKISAFTIHGVIGQLSGCACENDADLRNIIHALNAGTVAPRPFPPYEHLIIDETQDMCPLYRDAIVAFVRHTRGSVHMMVLGDVMQTLYAYRTGIMKSNPTYLLSPGAHFAEITPEGAATAWKFQQLSMSFRLTPKSARFVNLLLGSNIVGGNTRSPDLPVKFIIGNSYVQRANHAGRPGAFVLADVTDLIDKYGEEHIMILAQSLKTSEASVDDPTARNSPPLPHLVNQLIEDTIDGRRRIHLYVGTTEYAGNAACARGKIRVLTYCGSKGTEAKCVIVIGGLAIFNPERLASREQLGVALSRHTEQLVVIHDRVNYSRDLTAQWGPQMYYPLPGDEPGEASSERMRVRLQELADEGVIELEDRSRTFPPPPGSIFPPYRPPPRRTNPQKLRPVYVTDRDELDPAVKQALLEKISFTDPVPMHAATRTVLVSDVSHTNPKARYGPEDVSNLAGMAVPYAVELHKTGGLSDVDKVLQGYAERKRKEAPRVKAGPPRTHDKIVTMIRRAYAGVKGARARWSERVRCAEGPIDPYDWLPDRAQVVDFFTIAAGMDALMGCAVKLVQLGARFGEYPAFEPGVHDKWINDAAFRHRLRNPDMSLFESGKFEQTLYFELKEPYEGADGMSVHSLVGKIDFCVTRDCGSGAGGACSSDGDEDAGAAAQLLRDDRVDGIELKTTHHLTDDHKLQTGSYACMLCITLGRAVRVALMNLTTGDIVYCVITSVAQAVEFLECYIRCKRPPVEPHPMYTVQPSPPGPVRERKDSKMPTGGGGGCGVRAWNKRQRIGVGGAVGAELLLDADGDGDDDDVAWASGDFDFGFYDEEDDEEVSAAARLDNNCIQDDD